MWLYHCEFCRAEFRFEKELKEHQESEEARKRIRELKRQTTCKTVHATVMFICLPKAYVMLQSQQEVETIYLTLHALRQYHPDIVTYLREGDRVECRIVTRPDMVRPQATKILQIDFAME